MFISEKKFTSGLFNMIKEFLLIEYDLLKNNLYVEFGGENLNNTILNAVG